MKPIFIILLFLGLMSCRNQEEKQINLGDYNRPDSTEAKNMPGGPEISSDSTVAGSKALDSIQEIDSTKMVPAYKMEKSK